MSDEFKSIAAIERSERARLRKEKRAARKTSIGDVTEVIKNTLIMLAITLVAGGILGLVYEVTKEPIALMEEKANDEANRRVFMLADSFSQSVFSQMPVSADFSDRFNGVDITDAIQAFDSDGQTMGYVIEVCSHEGYGGDIVFRIGVDYTGSINGISITSISETAGLGMRASEVLTPQFKNRNELEFEVVKTGALGDNQIDAISSATITSKAITKGVNAALSYFREVLMGGVVYES